MPREVDHECRRELVVKIATELVAKGGLRALTVRDVAKAAGYSTAIVSHYFEDKADLLLSTYRSAVDRAARRIGKALKADPGDVQACVAAILPITPAQRRDWRLWVAFWGMAVSDPAFEAEQKGRVDNAIAIFEDVFALRKQRGQIAGDADCALLARQTVALINGLAIQALFDPQSWPAQRQIDTVMSTIEDHDPPINSAVPLRRSTA